MKKILGDLQPLHTPLILGWITLYKQNLKYYFIKKGLDKFMGKDASGAINHSN